VAGLSLQPQRAVDQKDCCIGDALTMIPPVTGNGMSMAFESAELAINPLCRYSHGEVSWPEARQAVARACDAAFAERLRWARRLQSLMFSPLLRTPLGKALLRSNTVWNFMFAKTR
jgi:flavin-dependent dehydrogenase